MYRNTRSLAIIFLLIKAKKIVTSKELSRRLNVSARTIKSDIESIRYDIEQYGFSIASIKSRGYVIDVVEPKKYEDFLDELFTRYSHVDEIQESSSTTRTNWLIRKLVSSPNPVSVEDLASELYVNERIISELLRNVRNILSTYNLTIINKPTHGLLVIGSEMHKRLCMLDYYVFFNHLQKEEYGIESFDHNFDCPIDFLEKIRLIIMESISDNGKVIENHKMMKLPFLFLLTYNRFKDGQTLKFDEETQKTVVTYPEYEIVDNISKEANLYFSTTLSIQEKIFLTIMLVTYEDFYPYFELDKYEFLHTKATFYKDYLLHNLNDEYTLNFYNRPELSNNLVIFFIPLYLKQKYMIIENNQWRNYSRNYLRTFDQISIEIAYISAHIIYEKIGYMLCDEDIMQLAIIYNNGINERAKENYDKKLKIAINIDTNFRMMYNVYDYLKISKYQDYIECIHLYQAYEIPQIESLAKYDLLFTEKTIKNIEKYALTLHERCAWVPDLSERENFYLIERYLSSMIRFYMYNDFAPDKININIIDRIDFSTKIDAIDYLCQMHIKSTDDFQKLREYFINRETLVSYETENNLSIFSSYNMTKNNSINILCLEKPLVWDRKVVDRIIYFNFNDIKSVTFLELVIRICKKVVYENSILDSIIAQGNREFDKNDMLDVLF